VEQLGSHWTDFHEIWHLNIFRKSVEKIQVSVESDMDNGHFTWRPMYIFDHISLNSCYIETIFRQKFWRNKNTHFTFSNFFFFSKIWPLMKWCVQILKSRTGHRWQYNATHAHGMLDTQGWKHAFRICNIYCFSTAIVVARTRINVALYVKYLPC
jgi:hypothetical protein